MVSVFALQGRLDLRADMVIFIEEPGSIATGRRLHPALADQNQNRGRLADLVPDLRLEVFARIDSVHIQEYVARPEQTAEPVVKPSCGRRGIDAPVADKDFLSHFTFR